MARRVDPGPRLEVADTLNSGGNAGGFRTEPGAHLVVVRGHGDRAGRAGGGADDNEAQGGQLVSTFVKVSRPRGPDGDGERWAEEGTSPTLSDFDSGDSRAVTLVAEPVAFAESPALLEEGAFYDGLNQRYDESGTHRSIRIGRDSSDFVVAKPESSDDALLPEGLDSNRYRCCGNGVVAPVAEWLGRRIAAYLESEA